MKIEMISTSKVMVLTKNETPWDMDGRTGISYKLGVMVKDSSGTPDIDKIKVTKAVFDSVKLGMEYTLMADVTVNNGKTNILFSGVQEVHNK